MTDIHLVFIFRLVYLEKCGHCVESNELLKWMETSNASVGMKLCPKCNSPIIKCARIINKIKELQNDVMRVKEKTFLNDKNKNFREIQQRCVEVLKEINESRLVSGRSFKFETFNKIFGLEEIL